MNRGWIGKYLLLIFTLVPLMWFGAFWIVNSYKEIQFNTPYNGSETEARDLLVMQKWCTSMTGFNGDHSWLSFQPTGQFESGFATDYTIQPITGQWKMLDYSNGEGTIQLQGKGNQFSLRQDQSLVLGSLEYKTCQRQTQIADAGPLRTVMNSIILFEFLVVISYWIAQGLKKLLGK